MRKGRIFLSLSSLFILSSCSFKLDSFSEIFVDKEEALKDYQDRRAEAAIELPAVFTMETRVIKGSEEERKPLFGNIIYKEKKSESHTLFAYDEKHNYYRFKSDGYDSSDSSSFYEEGIAYAEDKKIIVEHVAKNVLGEEIEESPLRREEYSYDTRADAVFAFKEMVAEEVKSQFASYREKTDSLFDAIPSHYNPNRKEATTYRYFVRPKETKTDFKISLETYYDKEKYNPLDSYLGLTQDYVVTHYREIKRTKVEGEGQVAYKDMALTFDCDRPEKIP